jgi:hypothetical protein
MEDVAPRKKGHVRENLREVESAPNGFDSYHLDDDQLLEVCRVPNSTHESMLNHFLGFSERG